MSISYTFNKKQVYVTQDIEGYNDVIACVRWEFDFTDGTYHSVGVGETFFDLTDPTHLVSADQVTDAMLEEWVVNETLAGEWKNYVNYHSDFVKAQAKYEKYELYYSDEV